MTTLECAVNANSRTSIDGNVNVILAEFACPLLSRPGPRTSAIQRHVGYLLRIERCEHLGGKRRTEPPVGNRTLNVRLLDARRCATRARQRCYNIGDTGLCAVADFALRRLQCDTVTKSTAGTVCAAPAALAAAAWHSVPIAARQLCLHVARADKKPMTPCIVQYVGELAGLWQRHPRNGNRRSLCCSQTSLASPSLRTRRRIAAATADQAQRFRIAYLAVSSVRVQIGASFASQRLTRRQAATVLARAFPIASARHKLATADTRHRL